RGRREGVRASGEGWVARPRRGRLGAAEAARERGGNRQRRSPEVRETARDHQPAGGGGSENGGERRKGGGGVEGEASLLSLHTLRREAALHSSLHPSSAWTTTDRSKVRRNRPAPRAAAHTSSCGSAFVR